MPTVAELRVVESDHPTPESIALHLPSGMPTGTVIPGTLLEKEKRLRLAQVEDSLVELRRLLRVTMGLWDYKYHQLGPSQRANTRARTIITRFQDKVNHCAEHYRAARSALLTLDPGGAWSEHFLELKPEHVKGPGRSDDDVSEGRRELSWIWMAKSRFGEESEEDLDKCEWFTI